MRDSSENSANAQLDPFGPRLRHARETAGLTQEELAARAGLTTNAVGALERGEHRHPYPATIRALAAALGLTDDERAALAALVPPRGDRTGAVSRLAPGLPAPPTALIGREREVTEVSDLLREEGVRLVTLTGPGGVGKTRLALAIGEAAGSGFANGIVFVDLSSIRDPDLLVPAIAERLGIQRAGNSDAFQVLATALGRRQLLLIIDNVEQIVAGAQALGHLVAACRNLHLLVTSRTTLRLSGEHIYPVSPLALPDSDVLSDPDRLADSPAVHLFAERARAADPGFRLTSANAAAVAAICHRLDGLPLAIELAAARTRHLPPSALLSRLSQRLPLLISGLRDQPARQQTMRDTIAWSDDLLTNEEQTLFRRLSVFVGSFSLEAAETIAGEAMDEGRLSPTRTMLDGIAALVDASLLRLRPETSGVPRYRMLETVREYGLERLAAMNEEVRARDAHAAYFGAFDQRLDPNRVEPGEHVDDRLWRIEADYPNLRSALVRLAETGNSEGVLRLAGAMAIFWHHRGHLGEGRQWLELALARTPDRPSASRARALAGLSLVIWSQGDYEQATHLAQTSRDMAERIGDADLMALSTHLLGMAEIAMGHAERAAPLMEEAFRRWLEVDSSSDAAMALMNLSGIANRAGDVTTAAHHAEEALTRFRRLGHPSGISNTLVQLARFARDRGDDRGAALAYREALDLWADVDARWSSVADIADNGDASLFPRWASIVDRRSVVGALLGLAVIAVSHDQPEEAATLLGAIDLRIGETGYANSPPLVADCTRVTDAAYAALGSERFDELRTAGRNLSLKSAVVKALEVAVPGAPSGRIDSHRSPPSADILTAREREVLRLLVERWSDKEIAAALFLSPRTVSTHVTKILTKLDVGSRREAADVAARDGLV